MVCADGAGYAPGWSIIKVGVVGLLFLMCHIGVTVVGYR